MRELEVSVFQDKLALLNQSTVEKTVNLPIFAKISTKELQLISWETMEDVKQNNKKSFCHGNHFHFLGKMLLQIKVSLEILAIHESK